MSVKWWQVSHLHCLPCRVPDSRFRTSGSERVNQFPKCFSHPPSQGYLTGSGLTCQRTRSAVQLGTCPPTPPPHTKTCRKVETWKFSGEKNKTKSRIYTKLSDTHIQICLETKRLANMGEGRNWMKIEPVSLGMLSHTFPLDLRRRRLGPGRRRGARRHSEWQPAPDTLKFCVWEDSSFGALRRNTSWLFSQRLRHCSRREGKVVR